jgi:hypothetical protein
MLESVEQRLPDYEIVYTMKCLIMINNNEIIEDEKMELQLGR